jgi:hypothetical protein
MTGCLGPPDYSNLALKRQYSDRLLDGTGNLDASYGSGGLTYVNPGTGGDYSFKAMSVYSDGSVVAAASDSQSAAAP